MTPKSKMTFALLALIITPLAYAEIDADKLVRVTDETKQKCVEYFNYKGAMFCSTTPIASQTLDPQIKTYEKQKIVFDERPWKLAWGQKTRDVITVEYIPMGSNINSWHELVTSQFFPELQDQASPKEFADKVLEGIRDAGFSPIVRFIKDTPDQVIFEFRIEKPAAQVQDEIQIITKANDGIYSLHYVIKEADMGNKRRDQWIMNLSNSGNTDLTQSQPRE